MQNNYSTVTTYDGLKGLRFRRSMYLGNTTIMNEGHCPHALIQTAQEVMSNSIDEFLAGYGKDIYIKIHPDNSVTVTDNGRGLPKGADDTFDSVIASLTKPHSSGKFEGDGYNATGIAGMNGIGLKATNATSRYVEVHAIAHSSTFVNKNDEKPTLDGGYEEYYIRFEQENVVEKKLINKWSKDDVKVLSNNTFEVDGKVYMTGTTITYLPDDGPEFKEGDNLVFESINWTVSDLIPRFNSSAFLNAKLNVHFIDTRQKLESTIDEEGNVVEPETEYFEKTWCYERGLEEYVEQLSSYQTLLSKVKKPITFDEEIEYEGMTFRLQASFIVTDDIDTNLKSFANSVPTKSGGPHLDGFEAGLTKAINDYAKDKGLNKVKVSKSKTQTVDPFKIHDVFEGVTGVFELRVPSKIADFIGQTKDELATSQAKPVTQDIVYRNVSNWLYDNDVSAEQIVEKIIESKVARDSAIKARQEAKKARQSKGSAEQLVVLSKLETASSKNPKEKELYIVEGDSASGGHRNTITQAMLPLRGKIRNVEELSVMDALSNEEISTITSALGTGIGPAFDISDLQYYKIIISCFTGDTKVKSLDGNNYSFKELVDNGIKELWVYSMDKHGNVVPALAKNIRKTGETCKLVRITLDNNEIIESTVDHNFMTADGKYVEAQHLSVGDSLMPLYTKINDAGYEEYYDKNTNSWLKTYRLVAEMINEKGKIDAQNRLAVENHNKHLNSIQVHHKDYNKLNNHPDNLEWLTALEHFRDHSKVWSDTYNGTEKHINDVKESHKNGNYAHTYFSNNGYNGSEKHIKDVKDAHKNGKYLHTYFGNNGWNGSEKQRQVTAQNNKTQKHIDSVKKGKVLVSIKFLQMMNLPFDEYHYNYYRNVSSVKYNKILEVFDSYDEAYEQAKTYPYRQYQKACDYILSYDSNQKHRNQIAKVIKTLIEKNLEFDEDNYNLEKGSRTVNYENIIKYFESHDHAFEYAQHYNHKITNIEIVDTEKNTDVYCLTVDDYHNFFLGSGVLVKNCDSDHDGRHIALLLLTLFKKFYSPLVEKGHVFVTIPPLFKATKYIKGEPRVKFFYSDEEMNKEKPQLLEEGYNIQRFKGLGEMNDEEVTYALLDPKTRIIKRITINEIESLKKKLKILMGNDADLRKKWVEENVDYDKLYELI